MNQTKEDMKSLQNDLVNADKEISVRQIKEIRFVFWYQTQRPTHGCNSCAHIFPQSLKKKVELLQKTLSTPTRTNEALSRLIFERCACVCVYVRDPATGLKSHHTWTHFHENIMEATYIYGFSTCLSARPQWSWSSLTSTTLLRASTLTSTWLMTSLHQMMWPKGRHRSLLRKCVLTLQRKFYVAQYGKVWVCVLIW